MKGVLITGVAGQDGSPGRVAARRRLVRLDGEYVVIDDAFERPAEVDLLIRDASTAKSVLGWEPRTNVAQLIRLMVDADLEPLSR